MDIFFIIGVIIGCLALVAEMVLKGVDVGVLLNPSAALIIFVGTSAAVMNSYPRKEFLNIPRILRALLREKKRQNPITIVELIAELSQQARRDGLLSLEASTQNIDDRFLKKGLEMVVDGLEQDYIKEVLDTEIESMEERHRVGAAIFSSAGSYSPTLGVLGAVVGLIEALGNLDDTKKLCEMIGAAFVATLFGIFLGYVICHPISSRLKRKSFDEIRIMRIIVEGVLSIQAGENPKSIKMKLSGMLEPKERRKIEEEYTSGREG